MDRGRSPGRSHRAAWGRVQLLSREVSRMWGVRPVRGLVRAWALKDAWGIQCGTYMCLTGVNLSAAQIHFWRWWDNKLKVPRDHLAPCFIR